MSVGVMEDYKLRENYAPRTHWVGRGTGKSKDKDEVTTLRSPKLKMHCCLL